MLIKNDNNYFKEDKLDILDPQSLVKDIAVSLVIFNVGDGDNDYVCVFMKLKLPFEFHYIVNYKYQFW